MSQSSVARRFHDRPSIMNNLWKTFQQTGAMKNRPGKIKANTDKTDGRFIVTQVHKSE